MSSERESGEASQLPNNPAAMAPSSGHGAAPRQIQIPRETVEAAVTALAEEFASRRRTVPAKSRHYPHPFAVDESFIRKLCEAATACLRRSVPVQGNEDTGEPKFSGRVRYPDLSTKNFSSLDHLIAKSGNKRDPEQLTMELRIVTQVWPPAVSVIRVTLTTEKPLEIAELQLLDFPLASMDLEIEGNNEEWVETTFEELDPFLDSARLRGIYRPLLIFRNRIVVMVISWWTGYLGQDAYFSILRAIARPTVNAKREAFVTRVTGLPTAEQKLDELTRWQYSAFTDPIFDGLMQMAGGFLVLLVVASLGYLLYPKLVPRSGINVGLASKRYSEYENAFRFVVFTGVICGILIPAVRAIFF